MNTLQFFNLSLANEGAVENFLRNGSFCTLFVSMMFYWIQTAFSFTATPPSPLPLPFPVMEPQKGREGKGGSSLTYPLGMPNPVGAPSPPVLFGIGAPSLIFWGPLPQKITVLFGVGAPKRKAMEGVRLRGMEGEDIPKKKKEALSILGRWGKQTNFGTITMIFSNFLLVCLLICRWRESGHFPLSNLYESLMFLSWSCTFIHLLLEYKTALKVVRSDATLLTKLIGSITSPSALFTNAFATFSLPLEMQKASPLVPALQSNWLMMHVTVMIISYSALILGSLLSIAFLILVNVFEKEGVPSIALHGGGNPSSAFFGAPTPSIAFLFGGDGAPKTAGSFDIGPIRKERSYVKDPLSKIKNNLAWNFDNLSYRVVGIGFPFLTIGILSGAVWANEAWGSYWSWDPKETWALITWTIYAIYLHARITKGWQGTRPALIASFGLVAVWFCFLGVNLIGEGLHSYGWFSAS